MTEIYGIYAIFLLISIIITLYLAFYSWNKRSNHDAIYFSPLMLAVSIWAVMSAFEMASTSISTKGNLFKDKLSWNRFYRTFVAIILGS